MTHPFLMWKDAKALWPAGLAAVAVCLAMRAANAPSQTNLTLLTTAQQVHELTVEEAKLGYPVRVRGVVTFYDNKIEELFIEDETGGIFVEVHGTYGLEMRAGQVLEIEGTSAPGGFAPDIKPIRIRCAGETPMPPPRVVTFEQMAAGQEDCSWVEFSGIARSVTTGRLDDLLGLEIAGGGGRVMALIKAYDLAGCQQLIDAEVTVHGVCVTHFNRKRQLLQVAIQATSMADILVQKPAPANPFGAKVRPINSLQQFAPGEAHGHRVKVQGVVTLQLPGRALCIADETQGLYVRTKQTTSVRPGDLVEVLGFPGSGEYSTPVLQDAIFRKVGTRSPPVPIKITAEDAAKGGYNASLVQMDARLLNRLQRQHDQILELQSGDFIFDAQLNKAPASQDPLSAIPNHSRVQVTGICLVPVEQERLPQMPRSFGLLLRSSADLAVIERASWWTTEHALWILAATLVVFSACLAWLAVLRKRVKIQTEIISQKLQREAALEERARIARDLHDDLGASLNFIAFLSKLAQKETENPRATEEHLRVITTSAQESVQALDEVVWLANPKSDRTDSLANYICQYAEGIFRLTPTRCRLDLPANLPAHPLSTEARNSLFLAVKEALHNIRKHAQASEVTIRIGLEAGVFSIAIEDNGRGFSPEKTNPNRNGLLNMKKRLEKIGGRFELETQPESGTKVRLTVQL